MNFPAPFNIPRFIVLKLIRLYQSTLSLDHSQLSRLFPYGYCRFHPTCSEYSYQAVERYGVIKGTWIGFKRIIKCHPWNPGGHDPLK